MMEIFILGAPDPEMEAIEGLLRQAGVAYDYATLGGQRVRPHTAYRADSLGPLAEEVRRQGGEIIFVECGLDPALDTDCAATVLRADHHNPGDPGYGLPPSRYWEASSLGQVALRLGVEPTPELRLVAAADHCLAAAYRGECPGVDPDALMRWRAESRARFQGRSVEEVLADIEAARKALREADTLWLSDIDAAGICSCGVKVMETEDDPSWDYCLCPTAADMRGCHVPELPEASAREGICFVADGLPLPDGRVKIVCQSGSPEQIHAFMHVWAPAEGLQDIYGDPARGFAGGYMAPAERVVFPSPEGREAVDVLESVADRLSRKQEGGGLAL